MTPREFYFSESREHIREVTAKAGTSFDNFKQIAIANGSVGKMLAAKLAKASDGKMSELEILYPERFEEKNRRLATAKRRN